MKVLVVTSGIPFVRGGPEILAGNLCRAISAAGHAAELISIPFQHEPPNRIPDQMLACRLLDLTETCGVRIDRVIALRFPAYLTPHPHKVIWLVNQHRAAYERWDYALAGDLIHYPDGPVTREAIRQADRELFQEARAVYTISKNVSDRLRRCCGMAGEPLYHPPPHASLFHNRSCGDYFFFPSRVTGLNRQLLVIEALARCQERTPVRFAGGANSPQDLAVCVESARRLNVEHLVEWLDWVSEEQKAELYANCLGVIFPPLDADYGYVALEAMLSSKPVITCSDAGGPVELVADRQTGLVSDSTPESLARAMDALAADRGRATAMGEAGRARYADLRISWENVVEKLLC